ncbi:putative mitochondrial import inner membrane translocase subunit Tim10 B-like [Apostichopus japonicus]|uniref:Mitochondrial import inner membrane translocase subunit n=1 Tax=Stichopus japonicus TaxID=307972 RepID=A0A2G8K0S4_STIJA|nr:putative mitochondrial import inner membrane translocase subunit Tim10 B-like [Apostichopus japonicus]
MNQAEAARRNMKDFLTMYNNFTESCFNSCARNFNYRSLTPEEQRCTDRCTDKLVNINHRLISVYVEINPMNRQLASAQETPTKVDQPQQPLQNELQPPESQPQPVGNLASQVQDVFGEGTKVTKENSGHVITGGADEGPQQKG